MAPEDSIHRRRARELGLLSQGAGGLLRSPTPATAAYQLPSQLEALVLCQRQSPETSEQGPPGQETPVRITAGGDLGFSGRLAPRAGEEGAGPLDEIAPLLRRSDAAFANLESPLPRNVPEGALFAGPPEAANRLAAAGLNVLSLANNHALDYGPDGLLTTLQGLHWARISSVGAGEGGSAAHPVLTSPRHHEAGEILWLATARTLEPAPPHGPCIWELQREELLNAVTEASERRRAGELSAIVVSIHFGYMFIDYPDPEQRRLALEVAAAGADLVLAHHAHVLQGIEVVDSGPRRSVVCHNLGNLLFDWQEGEIATTADIGPQRSGALLVFDLDAHGVAQAFALPVWVEDDMSLRWALGSRGEAVLDRLQRLSEAFASPSWQQEFRRQRGERNTGLAVAGLWKQIAQGHWGVLFSALRRLRPHHLTMLGSWLLGRVRRRADESL
ncbi:MAG: CapA family protein [Acidobacteriota bacterium]